MHEERRAHERKRLRREAVPGRFYLIAQGQRVALEAAQDVSVSGMGLSLPAALPVGEALRVGYQDEGFAIELAATVAWCEPQDDGSYRLGIRFSPDPAQANDNALFFMTLREYLDDFGG